MSNQPRITNELGPPATEEEQSGNGALTGLLWLVTAGVLAQAIFAGMFISGTAETRLAHLIVGSLLPWVAIAPAVIAVRHSRRLPQALVTGTVLLPVVLWAQEALGHMPFQVSTAVHVPLGVLLFAGSLLLAIRASRH